MGKKFAIVPFKLNVYLHYPHSLLSTMIIKAQNIGAYTYIVAQINVLNEKLVCLTYLLFF